MQLTNLQKNKGFQSKFRLDNFFRFFKFERPYKNPKIKNGLNILNVKTYQKDQ